MIKRGDKVTVINTSSYAKAEPCPFKATVEENIDGFEYWVVSDVTGNFYALYDISIKESPYNQNNEK